VSILATNLFIADSRLPSGLFPSGFPTNNIYTRNVYILLVGKTKGKRPLGRPRRKWIDNIKMDLVDRIECCGLDWSGPG
jgi:hypothetical protein